MSKDREKKKINLIVPLEYYQESFLRLHKKLDKMDYNLKTPHPCKKLFWKKVAPGIYSPKEGREYLLKYIDFIERALKKYISRFSLTYWIHIYRRLAPGPIGHDKQFMTIMLTRAIMEAAIQKYAKLKCCEKIAVSNTVSINEILDGSLADPKFKIIRNSLKKNPQLVLKNFGMTELCDFYEIEKLTYEIWRSTALLRSLGKGARLIVKNKPPEFEEIRSSELNELITIFDKRNLNQGIEVSVTSRGTVYSLTDENNRYTGVVFLPFYNVSELKVNDIFDKIYGLHMTSDFVSNFIWRPINLRNYYNANKYYSDAFYKKYNISFDSVLAVVGALLIRVFYNWHEEKQSILRCWQRAYEGTYNRSDIYAGIKDMIPVAAEVLHLDKKPEDIEVESAIRFWGLNEENRSTLDLAYPGPHRVFLPFDDDKIFIDYVWILRRLWDLFVDCKVSNENFKGKALEEFVQYKKSILPTTPCKALNGQMKQIDASFEFADRLMIVECKAVGRSIGFERGDPKAINYRKEKIKSAISEVDEKANWLAKNKKGTNFDISSYKLLIPIVVTPFVEFIPSLDPKYWLYKRSVPRILTLNELKELLKGDIIPKIKNNIVFINTKDERQI